MFCARKSHVCARRNHSYANRSHVFALVETMLTPVKTMFTPVEGMFMPRKRHVYAPVSVREGKLEFVTRDFVTLRGFHSADEGSGGKIAGIIC